MNYEDILNYNDLLNETFGTEDMDLIEEDYYDEDVATEASVKGATKKAFAFVANIIRRVIDAITRWIKNRSINKLVAFLKNKVAKFDGEKKPDEDANGNQLYIDNVTGQQTTSAKDANGKKNTKVNTTSDQRNIWLKLRKTMDGYTNKSVTDTWAVFCNLIGRFKSADELVRLQALLRQIKSTPVDKFGKELSGLKTTKGFSGNTVIGEIGSGNGILSLFPIINMLVTKAKKTGEIDKTNATNGFGSLTKGQCDLIGKSLKALMACISHFMLKTMRYYQSKEDQWTMTSNQKQIVAAIKNCQKIVYDIIKAANVAIGAVNTDNFEEADNESVELDMNDMIMDMMITNESLSDELIANDEIMNEDYSD
jgi:hypothetical protein